MNEQTFPQWVVYRLDKVYRLSTKTYTFRIYNYTQVRVDSDSERRQLIRLIMNRSLISKSYPKFVPSRL